MNRHEHFNLPSFPSTFAPLSSLAGQSPIHNFLIPSAIEARWWSHPTASEYNNNHFAEMEIVAGDEGVRRHGCLSPVSVETVDPRWLTRSASTETKDEEIDEMGQASEEDEGSESSSEKMEAGSVRTGGKKRPGSKEFEDRMHERSLMGRNSWNTTTNDGQSSQSSRPRQPSPWQNQHIRTTTVIDLTSPPPTDDPSFLPRTPISTIKSPFLIHTFSQFQSASPPPRQANPGTPDSTTSNLSSVPSTFVQRTPPLPKIFDSVTVISTPSPLPTPTYTAKRDSNKFTHLRRGRKPGRKRSIAEDGGARRGRPPRDPTRRSRRMVPGAEVGGMEWTEEELRRVGELRMSKKRLSWRKIAVEIGREVVDVRTTWRKRVKHRATTPALEITGEETDVEVWDEYKV